MNKMLCYAKLIHGRFLKWSVLKGCLSGLLFLLLFQESFAQVSGTVFRDFDANGLKATGEPGVAGVVVTAFLPNGTSVVNTSTATGTYTFTAAQLPSTTTARLEFSNLPASNFSGPYAAATGGSGTTVQFVTAGAAATAINFGVNFPDDYCQANPNVAIPCYVNGAAKNSSVANENTIVQIPYSANSTTTGSLNTYLAQSTETGTVYGMAYKKDTKKLFMSAFVKRHTGLLDNDNDGNGDLGAIYQLDATTNTVTLFTTVPNAGTIGNDATRGLGTLTGTSRDATAFPKVGKEGLGDMDISQDGQYLYVVNLFSKELVRIDIATKTQTTYPIPTDGCTNGVRRPFGLGIRNGKIFVGTVCTGESGGGTLANMEARVYEFDGSTFTSVLNFSLNYPKGRAINGGPLAPASWLPWTDDRATFFSSYATFNSLAFLATYNQPILSDIDFDENGQMLLGFMDRGGHQGGHYNRFTDISNDLWLFVSGGDLLTAYPNNAGTAWTIESGGDKDGAGSSTPLAAQINNQGPGGGEFYNNETFGGHQETAQGGLAVLLGSRSVITTLMDPYTVVQGGVGVFSNTNGSVNSLYPIFESSTVANTGTFGKAAGLGDITLLCNPAPIEIGNRVWNDTNKNGIQDPAEPALVGVTVKLCDSLGVQIPNATAVTDSKGNFIFSSANLTSTANSIYGLAISPATKYQIKVTAMGSNASVTGLALVDVTPSTPGESGAVNSGQSLNNNDAKLVSGQPTIMLKTGVIGENNHNFDIGFACVLPIITATNYTKATCAAANNVIPNNNASLQISTNGDKAAISATGVPTTTYAAATAVTAGSVTLTAVDGAADSLYVRIFNGANCYLDTIIKVTPVVCCPAITFGTPANFTAYCSEATIATLTATTTARSPDSLAFYMSPTKLTAYNDIIGTQLLGKVKIAGTAASNNVSLTNIKLPELVGTDNDTLYIYSVYVDDLGDTTCKVFAEKPIILKPEPTASIDGFTTACNSVAVTLTSEVATTYKWGRVSPAASNLGTAQTLIVTPPINATTTYWLITTNAGGCSSDTAFHTITTSAGILGTVYRDFDSDGIKDATEKYGVKGIEVKAYDCDGKLLGTTTTDEFGRYNFNGITAADGKVRIEFSTSTLPAFYQESFAGTNNGTDVQFVTAPNCNVDWAVKETGDYCQANPFLTTTCFVNGAANTVAPTEVLVKFAYNSTGFAPDPSKLANKIEIGSVWGLAYNNQTTQLYSSTFLKRHVGLKDLDGDNKGDLGIIWQTSDPQALTSTNAVWANLAKAPYNLDLGTIGDDAARGLGNPTAPSNDATAFPLIGKVGLGDIDISDDNSAVWVVNPKASQLHKIAINANGSAGAMTTFNIPKSCGNAFDTLYVQSGGGNFGVTNNGFSSDNFYDGGFIAGTGQPGVPYSLARFIGTGDIIYRVPVPNGTYQVMLYVGTNLALNQTNTVEGTAQVFTAAANTSSTQLFSTVTVTDELLDITITDIAGGTARAMVSGIKIWSTTGNKFEDRAYPFALNYSKGKVYVGTTCNAEFSQNRNELKSIVYELIDNGSTTFTPVLTVPLTYKKGPTGGNNCGDGIYWHPWLPVNPSPCALGLHSYPEPLLSDIELDVDGSMILGYTDRHSHQGGAYNYPPIGTNLTYTQSSGDILRACNLNGVFQQPGSANCPNKSSNNQGPNGGEYYCQDVAADGGTESTQGGLALLPGQNEVVSTAYDPNGIRNGGVLWFNNSNGTKTDAYEVYEDGGTSTVNFGKGTGLGDLELLCDAAPIQIGNYIWLDADKDGVQDPCELPAVGVNVYLYTKAGVLKDSTVTNATGNWYFSSSTDSIKTNTAYFVVLGGASQFNKTTGVITVGGKQYQLTSANTGQGPNADQNDSDALTSGVANVPVNLQGFPVICDTTGGAGYVNHTLDIGLTPPSGSLGDFVWKDTNNNGKQDAGEAGVKNVIIELYKNGSLFAKDTTDALGKYGFMGLDSASYYIKVVAGSIPTGCLISQNPNAAGVPDSLDSDIIPATLQSQTVIIDPTSITGVSLKDNPTLDVALYSVKGSLGDFVWKDLDNDGRQDAGEPGVKGVIIELFKNNAFFAKDTTDTFGEYGFIGLDSASYYIKVVAGSLPDSCAISLKPNEAGVADSLDSDIIPATLQSQTVIIDPTPTLGVSLKDNPTLDVALRLRPRLEVNDPCTCFRVEYFLTEKKELFEEMRIISAPGELWRVVSQTGMLELDSAVLGRPKVPLAVGAPYEERTPGKYYLAYTLEDNIPYTIKVTNGADTINYSNTCAAQYPNITLTVLSKEVCKNSPPIPLVASSVPAGPLVFFYEDKITKQRVVITEFDPSKFTVNDTIFVKLEVTPTNPSQCKSIIIQPVVITTKDCAIGSLGDFVWKDANNNGIQDETGTGVKDVILELYKNGSATGIKDTTDATGKYLFSISDSASYQVKIVSGLPAGCTISTKQNAAGSTDANDSDFNPTSGLSDVVTVNPSNPAKKDVLTVDAALYSPKGSLGDFVWKDTNNNGIQDETTANNGGVAGVQIELYKVGTASAIAKDTTDATGKYLFANLEAGQYYIKVLAASIPSGCIISTKKDVATGGGTETNDSDVDPATGQSGNYTIDPSDPTKKDILTVDAALYSLCIKPTLTINSAPTCSSDKQTYSVTFSVTGTNGILKANGVALIGNNPYVITIPSGTNLTITDSLSALCKHDTTILAPSCGCPVSAPVAVAPSVVACQGEGIPMLSVSVPSGVTANWYASQTSTTALVTNSLTYIPATAGTYWVEAVVIGPQGCVSTTRTPIKLSVISTSCVPVTVRKVSK